MPNATPAMNPFHLHFSRGCGLVSCWLMVLAVCALVSPSTWAAPVQQAYVKAAPSGSGDGFGHVAIWGDTMVVGAPFEDGNATGVNGNPNNKSATNSGAVYVFVRTGANWTQQAYIKASNTGTDDRFGWSVAIYSNTLAVGAIWESSNARGVNGNQNDNSASGAGAVYIYVRTGTNWNQQAYLKASNAEESDAFGTSVALSGETLVVGANYEESGATGVNGNQNDNSVAFAGAAYVFVRSGTNWTQQAYLKASNPGPIDFFGWSVAVSGNTVVVGAPGEDSNAIGVNGNQSNNSASDSGAAYVFVRSGSTWSQQAYLKASNTGANDGFGTGFGTVGLSANTLVVGAPGEDSNSTGVDGNQGDNSATNSGAAYVFVRNGTTWSQQAYLKASNTEKDDGFGVSLGLFGDTIVVASYHESSNATGINGNQSDNGATNSGAAYVFVRSGSSWEQQAYLKASNTDPTDRFGFTIAVWADTVVVGTPFEASNATGVNGDQDDNSAYGTGAAYVFAGLGLGPRLSITPNGTGGYLLRLTGVPGLTYRLERATSLTSGWSVLFTNTALASGLVEFHDTAPLAGQAFYRSVRP